MNALLILKSAAAAKVLDFAAYGLVGEIPKIERMAEMGR
jgi:hypothetical protein